MESQSAAIAATKAWLENVIVALNFCPFAKKELLNNTIRYLCSDYRETKTQLTDTLAEEIRYLDENKKTETTLIIVHTGLESFFTFLDVLDVFEDWIDENQYRGVYQIASFHPDYCFEDEHYDAPSNYTNRSPFPVFHLLREDSMEKAIAAYKQPERIPHINIKKANELGAEALQALLASCLQQR